MSILSINKLISRLCEYFPPRLVAIFLMITTVLFYSFLDANAKYLMNEKGVPPLQVIALRFDFHALLYLFLFSPKQLRTYFPSKNYKLQIFRSFLALFATLINFTALNYLQLGETAAISFAQPLVLAAIAGPILGEWIGPRRWAAVGCGFIGVVIITQFWSNDFNPYMMISVTAVFFFSFYNLATRVSGRYDSPITSLLWVPFAGAIVLLPFTVQAASLLLEWDILLLFFMTGLWGLLGHYFIIEALRLEQAAIVIPYSYSQIIWMVIIGWLLFDQVPGSNVFAGAAIIIASGIYLFYRDRAQSKKDMRSAAAKIQDRIE